MVLPTDAQERKNSPIYSGVLKYFPNAMAAIAHCSKVGNDQHNPGQPLHWAREKSSDHHDCMIRHAMEAGTVDTDGVRHSTKAAWRALAALELELEAAQGLQDKPDDDGWIVADPNCPPKVVCDIKWHDGTIYTGRDCRADAAWWRNICLTEGETRVNHWRPSKES